MANEKILVVDDDKNICELLRLYLVKEGYSVTMAHDGEAALTDFDKLHPDLVLLDVMMPVMDGWEVCRKIRAKDNTPIIMLTAKGETTDKVSGLKQGADDYITKPFRVRELISRMNSVLRRAGKKQAETTINYQDLSINTIAARVFKNNQEVFLTGMEYRLLLILATHRNQVMTRDQLFEAIWDLGGEYVNDNTLTVYIKRLREKLEDDPAHPQLIRTIRGLGYKLGE